MTWKIGDEPYVAQRKKNGTIEAIDEQAKLALITFIDGSQLHIAISLLEENKPFRGPSFWVR